MGVLTHGGCTVNINHSLVIAALSLIASTSPVRAVGQEMRSDTDVAYSTVHFDDLDLNSPAARRVLTNRLEDAARNVCVTSQFSSGSTTISDPACVRAAMANADAQMTMALAGRGPSANRQAMVSPRRFARPGDDHRARAEVTMK